MSAWRLWAKASRLRPIMLFSANRLYGMIRSAGCRPVRYSVQDLTYQNHPIANTNVVEIGLHHLSKVFTSAERLASSKTLGVAFDQTMPNAWAVIRMTKQASGRAAKPSRRVTRVERSVSSVRRCERPHARLTRLSLSKIQLISSLLLMIPAHGHSSRSVRRVIYPCRVHLCIDRISWS